MYKDNIKFLLWGNKIIYVKKSPFISFFLMSLDVRLIDKMAMQCTQKHFDSTVYQAT